MGRCKCASSVARMVVFADAMFDLLLASASYGNSFVRKASVYVCVDCAAVYVVRDRADDDDLLAVSSQKKACGGAVSRATTPTLTLQVRPFVNALQGEHHKI